MSDRLEDIYNEEATQYRYEKDMQKRLYCKIAEVQDQKNREKRSIEKQMNKMENQQIDYFWKVHSLPILEIRGTKKRNGKKKKRMHR